MSSHAEQVRDGSVLRATAVFEAINQWLYMNETADGELNVGITFDEMEAFLETRWEPPLTVPEKTWILQSWPGRLNVDGVIRFFSGEDGTGPPAEAGHHSQSQRETMLHQEQQHRVRFEPDGMPIHGAVHAEQHYHVHKPEVVHLQAGAAHHAEPSHNEQQQHVVHAGFEYMNRATHENGQPASSMHTLNEPQP
eukprot:CAMPEP_0180190598 /NCGR_PEP_ID=MMETSP0987-20121128/966_1 /TAXON_ID=697907 /ORGANISM="non described non described, Strain CCMP2293" /LENGTH=193 /DNA_ID=CAMNT_0022145037 /DNA_START=16 /DNA_END=595 /DNA_ORIENTATION=+